jgi:hypothetical protein
MNNIIRIIPDKDGKLFITLYGTRYEIIIEKKPSQDKSKN